MDDFFKFEDLKPSRHRSSIERFSVACKIPTMAVHRYVEDNA